MRPTKVGGASPSKAVSPHVPGDSADKSLVRDALPVNLEKMKFFRFNRRPVDPRRYFPVDLTN